MTHCLKCDAVLARDHEVSDAPPIRLDTLAGCTNELTTTTNNLARLDHMFTNAVDAETQTELAWERHRATAVASIRSDPTLNQAMTAGELNGRVRLWLDNNAEAAKAEAEYLDARDELRKIDRYYRTQEKRASNAQSASKHHLESPGNYGGSV